MEKYDGAATVGWYSQQFCERGGQWFEVVYSGCIFATEFLLLLVKNLSTELIITYVGATAQGQNITMLLNVTSIISIDSNSLTDV